MRILTRHILREFLTPVIFGLITFSAIYLIVDMFGEMEKILQARPSVYLVLQYMFGYLSDTLQWLVPAALLLGGLYSMWQLSRHSEITAMRATGIGFSTITAPILWTAVGFSILLALNAEFIAPGASRRSKQIKELRFEPGEYRSVYEDVPYHNVRDRREWRINRLDMTRNTAYGVRVTWTDEERHPIKVIEADKVRYYDGVWWFEHPKIIEHEKRGGVMQPLAPRSMGSILAMPELRESPRDFFLEVMQTESSRDRLSIRDMIRYTKARPGLTRPVKVGWRYDIYNRLAAPLTCLIITLFAVPAGVATGRQSVFWGVISAVALFLGYYALTLICGGLAKKDMIPVGAGVIAPDALLLIAGMVLYYRQR